MLSTLSSTSRIQPTQPTQRSHGAPSSASLSSERNLQNTNASPHDAITLTGGQATDIPARSESVGAEEVGKVENAPAFSNSTEVMLAEETALAPEPHSPGIDGFLTRFMPSTGSAVKLGLSAVSAGTFVALAGVPAAVGAVAGAVTGAIAGVGLNLYKAVTNPFSGAQEQPVWQSALNGATVGAALGAGAGALLSPGAAVLGAGLLVGGATVATAAGWAKIMEPFNPTNGAASASIMLD